MLRGRIAGIAVASSLILACGQASEQRSEHGWFEPHESGNNVLPSGVQPADRYVWASDFDNVHFHTLEDSEQTRDQWEPLYEQWKNEPLQPEWSSILPTFDWWRIEFRTLLRSDTQTQDLNYQMLNSRGGYYGIKLPGEEETLHMFECTYDAYRAIYLVDDILVECADKEGMDLHFKTKPETRDERPEHAPKIGQPYYDWWAETFQAAERAWETQSPDDYRRSHIYIYVDSIKHGVRAERLLMIKRAREACAGCPPPSPSEYTYHGPLTGVPPEMCSSFAVRRDLCAKHVQKDF